MFAGRKIDRLGRKARALISALVLSEEFKLSRESCIGLLWSKAESDEKARGSLRNSIYEAQKALQAEDCAAFGKDNQHLWLDKRHVEVDLWEAISSAREGRPASTLLTRDRVTDSILSDFESVDPSFHDWLLAKRQSMHIRLVQTLEDSLRALPQGTGDASVEPIARSLMRLDPTHEEAARALIRSRAAAGDLGAAFSIYRALWDLLERDFDIQPSMETQDLIAQIRLAQPENGLPPLALPTSVAPALLARPPLSGHLETKPARPRKLILNMGRFDASGLKPESRYLISGFRQELSACLVRFREWSVRDELPAAIEQRKGNPEGEYAITASAFETGNGIRLVLMLGDVSTGQYVWSERVVLRLSDWFGAQEAVVRRLATALNVHVSAERLAAIASEPNEQVHAYDRWLRGHALLLNFSADDWHKATQEFESIVSEHPNFAPAYVSLANAHNIIHIVHPGFRRKPERTLHALVLARRGVNLDPIDSRAQLCLGWSCAMSGEHDEAETHLQLALDLNGSDPWTMVSAATCLAFCGQKDRALSLANEVLALPITPSPIGWSYLATIYFVTGDYTACIAAADKAGSVNPNLPGLKAAALYLVGEKVAAALAYASFVETTQRAWFPGDAVVSEDCIVNWLLHLFPFRSEADLENLRRGILGAGGLNQSAA